MLISEKVMELRKKSPLNNSTLEKEIGVPKGSFDHWGKKDYQPSLSAIIKIAKYFNVTTDYLLGLTDDPQQASSPAVAKEPDKIAKVLNDYITTNNMQISEDKLRIALAAFATVLEGLNKDKE